MDVSSDGVYVTGLTAKNQAKFTGFQSMCWSIGPIFATGVLVTLSGVLYDEGKGMSYAAAWRVVLLVVAALMVALAVIHTKFLPPGAKLDSAPSNVAEAFKTFGDAWVSFFKKKSVWIMIAFAFFYRTSQGFRDKIGPLFMIDTLDKGGLGLNNEVLGWINGTVGTVGFIAGSLLGGLFVAKKGLRSVLMLLCIAINVPNATYIFLGLSQPDSVWVIGSVVTFEKFWFGFGAVGYMMQQLAPARYTAHYAFGTALMGLVMMLTGMASGYIQEALGYVSFFVFVMVATLPSFLVTFFAPFHVDPDDEAPPELPAPKEAPAG
jgi:PAT family beta-lactamase induction signal transducer AmpG